jgi:uncharacterized protein
VSAESQTPARPPVGTRLVFRWRKWDGSVHWEHDCVYLGSDAWGDWFGQPVGWRSARPGRDLRVSAPSVTLLPPGGDHVDTFNAPPAGYAIYIDLSWDAIWDGDEPTGIDMDLDVVSARDERGIWIDDRDEWEEHRVQYGYPLDIAEQLETAAIDLEDRVRRGVEPYDGGTAERWLTRLGELDLPEA